MIESERLLFLPRFWIRALTLPARLGEQDDQDRDADEQDACADQQHAQQESKNETAQDPAGRLAFGRGGKPLAQRGIKLVGRRHHVGREIADHRHEADDGKRQLPGQAVSDHELAVADLAGRVAGVGGADRCQHDIEAAEEIPHDRPAVVKQVIPVREEIEGQREQPAAPQQEKPDQAAKELAIVELPGARHDQRHQPGKPGLLVWFWLAAIGLENPFDESEQPLGRPAQPLPVPGRWRCAGFR